MKTIFTVIARNENHPNHYESPEEDYRIWNMCRVRDIGLAVSVFANGPGDLGSIPGRVIPKTQKWYLMPPCLTLSIIRYGSRVKWSNPGKGVVPFPTPWCSSYQKGGLWVNLDYGCQLYFINMWNNKNLNNRFICGLIHFCVCVCVWYNSGSVT